MKCNVCGNVVAEGAKECAVCGAKLADQVLPDKVTKEEFLTDSNKLMLIGLIPLFLLFYFLLVNIINYDNWRGFGGNIRTLSVLGLIFTIPMFIGVIAISVLHILYLFKKSIVNFEKISISFPVVGLIIHWFIAFFTLFLTIWRVAVLQNAQDFFNQLFFIYGLQGLHILLFWVSQKPKKIFPTKPAKPSQVQSETKEGE